MNQRIENAVLEIRNRVNTGSFAFPIVVSLTPNAVGNMERISFGQKCFQAAEIWQRWTAIGIEDWIKAGRWWVLRVSILHLDYGNFLFRLKTNIDHAGTGRRGDVAGRQF